MENTIHTGDNLEIMQTFPDACIDLIYLDPPFNTGKNWEAFNDIWTDEELIKFQKEWHGEIAETHEDLYQIIQATGAIYGKSMSIYLIAMAVRLFEMHRILKPTGSIYLHCDPTCSHYLKIFMDGIFGEKNFRNEIVWAYTRMSAKGQRQLSRAHDTIFWYSNGNEWCFNVDPIRLPYAEGSKAREGQTLNRLGSGHSKEGVTKLNPLGKFPEDWITHIPYLRGNERTGYPTQKPLSLLERIIKASSNEGDVVLDPFCGSGTTCFAAKQLGRHFIGIDENPDAIRISKERITSTVHQPQMEF